MCRCCSNSIRGSIACIAMASSWAPQWTSWRPLRQDARVSLRLKILVLACLVLAAFAVTTALSASLIRRVMVKMGGIVEYHVGLTDLLAEIDVLTFEYEPNLGRLIERRVGDPEQLQRAPAPGKANARRPTGPLHDPPAPVQRPGAHQR